MNSNRVRYARSTYTISDGVRLLDGAEVLFPANVGPRLFALHDKKQIFTAGSSVTMRETEAMRLVARATHFPVQVSKAYVQAGDGCIFMSWLEDEVLGDLCEQ